MYAGATGLGDRAKATSLVGLGIGAIVAHGVDVDTAADVATLAVGLLLVAVLLELPVER
jgi:hypothetical protein